MKNPWVYIVVILFVPIVAASQASDTQSARKLFKEGSDLFAKEQYAEAAERFRQAYATKPSYKILYNLGQSEIAAKRYGVALENFEIYLAEGGDEIAVDRQKEVRNEIARLRSMIGYIQIEAPNGTTIHVDGVLRGTYPTTQRIPVASMVVHEVKGTSGSEVFEQKIRVSGGDTVSVMMTPQQVAPHPPKETGSLEDDDVETKSVSPINDIKDQKKRLLVSGLVLSGTGLAAVVAGSICGGLVINKANMLESKCDGTVCTESERGIAESRDRLIVASAALWATGGAVVATGLALILVSRLKKETSNAMLVPTPGGITLTGRF